MQRRTGNLRALRALPLLALFAGLASPAASGPPPFALVGDRVIERAEYESALQQAVRQTFYHARPPETELAAFRRKVGEQLVDEALLLDEAQRRGIEPEAPRIEAIVSRYERRYAGGEQWEAARARMLPALRAQLRRQSVLEQLERSVRAVPAPDERETRAYYRAHHEQFTEPEQVRLSLIVLGVDPSSPEARWQEAHDEALALRSRLLAGEEFAQLARRRSADPSAANGGDLGYLHRGMLPEALESGVLGGLSPGEVSAPIRLLEGVALVRLEARKPAKLRSYEDVRRRAGELAVRAKGEAAWKTLIATLRSRVPIRMDESVYLSLPAK